MTRKANQEIIRVSCGIALIFVIIILSLGIIDVGMACLNEDGCKKDHCKTGDMRGEYEDALKFFNNTECGARNDLG